MDELRVLDNKDLFFQDADCFLSCCFCQHGIEKRLKAGSASIESHRRRNLLGIGGQWARMWRQGKRRTARSTRRRLAEIKQRIQSRSLDASADEHRITLAGWDVLESPMFLEVIDLCQEEGLAVDVVTPGRRLADRAFVARLSAHRLRFTLTYLSHRDDVFREMTGNASAKQTVELAMENLCEHGIPFSVNWVPTALNVRDLPDVWSVVAGRYARREMSIKFFSADKGFRFLPKAYQDQFASFDQLAEAMAPVIDLLRPEEKRLNLWHVPPCQLHPEALLSGCLRVEPDLNDDPDYLSVSIPACRSCEWDPFCFHINAFYQNAQALRPIDTDSVNRWFQEINRD